MISILYDKFKHLSEKGSVYIYGDPHFSDADCFEFRKANKKLPEGIKTVEELDDYQIKSINSIVNKNDTLIILGDVGNPDLVKKLKAGYKLVLTGNHDGGVKTLQRTQTIVEVPFMFSPKQLKAYRQIDKDFGHIDGPGDWAVLSHTKVKFTETAIKEDFRKRNIPDGTLEYLEKPQGFNYLKTDYKSKTDSWVYFVRVDTKLFDEVYTGPLMISDKIILSHEPIIPCPDYLVNLCGHVHAKKHKFRAKKHQYYNFCAEAIGYKPVSLGNLIKEGLLSKVKDIHRVTIDGAIIRKAKNLNNIV